MRDQSRTTAVTSVLRSLKRRDQDQEGSRVTNIFLGTVEVCMADSEEIDS